MAELLFNETNRAKQAVLWQTMISQEALKNKIIDIIKREHSILLSDELESLFSEIVEFFKNEEAEIAENLKNFKKEVKNDQ